MAAIFEKPRVELTVTLHLSEPEARALDGLAGYGDDAFVAAFYEKLGKHYMVLHEGGLRSLLKSCRDSLPGFLRRVDDARKAFESK